MSQNKSFAAKNFIVLTLALSLFFQSFSYYAKAAPGTNEPISNEFQIPLDLQEQANADATKLAAAIDGIENGSLAKQPIQNFDQFRLANQSIQIFEGGKTQVYNLNDYQVEIPTLAYTNVNAVYNKDTNELVLEATRGANKEGKNGVIVARQIIPNMNIAAMALDEEILSIVDKEGRLHAIDWGFVSEQLFKSPIPVFQNLWKPENPIDLTDKKVTMKYLTLGTKPFEESQLTDKAVLPRNAKGDVEFTAGDLAIEISSQDGQKQTELLGVFSREVSYARMVEGAKLIQWLAVIASPNNQNVELAESILKQIEADKSLANAADNSDAMSPVLKAALRQIKPDQLAALMQAAGRNEGLNKRARGKFSLEDWKKDYEEIYAKMKAEALKDPKNQNLDVDEAKLAKFEADLQAMVAKNWGNGITPVEVESPLVAKKQSAVAKSLGEIKNKTDIKLLAKIFAGVGAAYLGLPYGYDNFIEIEQMKYVSWMFENLYPEVLKDALYRTPLLLSTAALIAIWPASVAMSATIGKAFKTMSARLQNSDSKWAQNVRDLARNWGELNSWQRINSFGLRLYAWLMYPYWRVLSTLLRQKTFFTALENGLNPFTLIRKNSALGEKMGLTKNTFLGLNNPAASSNGLIDRSTLNLKLQGSLAEQKLKIENMAWGLASLVVCEKNQVDPATLLMVSSGEFKLDKSQMSEILDDPAKKAQWEAVADRLIQQYAEMAKNGADISKMDPELFNQYYDKAQEAMAKIETLPNWKVKLNNLRVQFKKRARQFTAAAVKLGKYDHEFLKKIYTNEWVSDQIKKEFSVDHIMVVGIVAFYGERADLENRTQLAADPEGLLWTSKAHWNDVFLNTFAHFFVAGAGMALLFQKPRPQSAKSYAPKEDYLYVSKDRPQGFISGVWSWTKDVSNPLKADLGGIMLKRFTKRFTTFTAGLTLSVGLRTAMLTGKMGLAAAFSVAKSAWIFNFFAAQWFYGVVWDPIQAGNKLEGERIARQTAELKEAKYLLSQGQYAEGHQKMMGLYFESNKTDLLRLELTVLKQVRDESLRDELITKKTLQVDMNSNEKYYFGLLSELAFALKTQDEARIAKAETLLKQLIARDQNLDLAEVQKLSAASLLKFSISNTPIYTEPNHLISWLSTWAGAVSSTVLAIPLSVILTTNSLMASPLFIGKWVLISIGMYGVSYLTLSKAMAERYVKFYNNYLADRLISKVVVKTAGYVSDRVSSVQDLIYQKAKGGIQKLTCEGLMKR